MAIKQFRKKNDIVFDPFLGSGTTIVEGKLLGHSSYGVEINPGDAENIQPLASGSGLAYYIKRPFLYEGRSVKVEVRITWAVTQPTPLVCRVKWAKIP